MCNTDNYVQATPSPGADNDCAVPPSINVIINEVDVDTLGNDVAEFIELYDSGSDNLSYFAFDLDGFVTNTDGYFVICGDNVTVANCDLEVFPTTDLIQDGEDAIVLVVSDAGSYPSGSDLPIDSNILDAIVYETGDDTDSGPRSLLNSGQSVANEGDN